MRTPARAAASLALAALAAHAVPAAGQAPTPTRGAVVQRVTSPSDAAQSYALYLPSRWEPGRRWPVLVVMDPGGQATVPMERFRAAAERNGWIVVSSWNTSVEGDSALADNDRAVNAIVADALERYAADSTRVYFAGFSGTARYAWTLPHRVARAGVAGIIGVGAGLPQPAEALFPELRSGRPFPYFGAAGSTDFNLDEVAQLDTALRATALPHHFAPFDGGHEWLPAELAERALDWMQLQAIALGAVPRDTAWLARAYAAGLERCRALEQRGAAYAAWEECHALVDDFLGLRDVSDAQARASTLAQGEAVRRERQRRSADALQYEQFRSALDALFSDLTLSNRGAAQRSLLGMLDIEKLQRREADAQANPGDRRMATRMLNTTAAVGTREGELFIQARRYRHAAAALRVARQARPQGPGVCWQLARALAQAHDRDGAFEALGCALDAHSVTAAQLQGEPLLEPLRADPRFTTLLSRPAAAAPPRASSDRR